MTIKTLQWLKKVDSGCYDEPAEPAPPVAPVPAIPAPPKPKPANVSMLTCCTHFVTDQVNVL